MGDGGGRGGRYSSVDTVKLGKIKKYGQCLCKNCERYIFDEMRLAGLLMKKYASFLLEICPGLSGNI